MAAYQRPGELDLLHAAGTRLSLTWWLTSRRPSSNTIVFQSHAVLCLDTTVFVFLTISFSDIIVFVGHVFATLETVALARHVWKIAQRFLVGTWCKTVHIQSRDVSVHIQILGIFVRIQSLGIISVVHIHSLYTFVDAHSWVRCDAILFWVKVVREQVVSRSWVVALRLQLYRLHSQVVGAEVVRMVGGEVTLRRHEIVRGLGLRQTRDYMGYVVQWLTSLRPKKSDLLTCSNIQLILFIFI